MRTFNTAGTCRPNEHYMVDITERLEIIRKMVAKGDYFCINKSGQHDEALTMEYLRSYLADAGYCVFSIDLDSFREYALESELYFGAAILDALCWCPHQGLLRNMDHKPLVELLRFQNVSPRTCPLDVLRDTIQQFSSSNSNPVVLLIDNVEEAFGRPAFESFLKSLDEMYCMKKSTKGLQSVVFLKNYDVSTKFESLEEILSNKSFMNSHRHIFDIETIKDGMPGITPAIGNYLYENCLVSLNLSGHTSGTEMLVNGLRKDTCQLYWKGQITDQMLRSYTDDVEITEQGAVCISVLMAKQLTDYTIIERSWRGTGIDYWLGYESDPLMQRVARLEISGIKTESATNTMSARYEQKVKQTELSDNTNLPAYISIIEFSTPKCLFNKREHINYGRTQTQAQ